MQPIPAFSSQVVVLPRDDIDTDQIMPARFLKGTERKGLGAHVFADWRTDPTFPLSRPEMAGRTLLLSGSNFGCGSSREHAPWALSEWGFRAVIARSFGDIFRGNALKNGLLPIVVTAEVHARLRALLEQDADATLTVDLATATLELPTGQRVPFPIDPFAQTMLLRGTDELGHLLALSDRILAFEQAHGT
jgi:3-isopropylmalate/(R)-2-methylmalate dehydratase small subunit